MVEHVMQRRAAGLLALAGAGQLRGIGTQQVVEHEAARRVLGDQVRAGELGQ
jgi:hypothetical protein